MLAALRPRMLELARDAADGAHPYFVPVEHTRRARAIARAGTSCWRRSWPSCSSAIPTRHVDWPGSTPAASTSRCRIRREPALARASATTTSRRRDPTRSIDAVVASGDEAAIVARIQEHLAAGADHVCLQPVTAVRPLSDGPDHDTLGMLRRLAPALRDAGLLAI